MWRAVTWKKKRDVWIILSIVTSLFKLSIEHIISPFNPVATCPPRMTHCCGISVRKVIFVFLAIHNGTCGRGTWSVFLEIYFFLLKIICQNHVQHTFLRAAWSIINSVNNSVLRQWYTNTLIVNDLEKSLRWLVSRGGIFKKNH